MEIKVLNILTEHLTIQHITCLILKVQDLKFRRKTIF